MTHEIDIQRVRAELKWDGFPGEKAMAKAVCIRQESDRMIANLGREIPAKVNLKGLGYALGISFLFWCAVVAVWVR